jgi:hypothetical protein
MVDSRFGAIGSGQPDFDGVADVRALDSNGRSRPRAKSYRSWKSEPARQSSNPLTERDEPPLTDDQPPDAVLV